MVDREGRDEVARLLVEFMKRRINNFEFDDALAQIDTKDKTLQEIINLLWLFYDDIDEHKINLDRYGYNSLNRLLLLLKSDALLKPKKLSISQRVAMIFEKEPENTPQIYPFPSFKSLRAVRESIEFKKVEFKEDTSPLVEEKRVEVLLLLIFMILIAFIANTVIAITLIPIFITLQLYSFKLYNLDFKGVVFE